MFSCSIEFRYHLFDSGDTGINSLYDWQFVGDYAYRVEFLDNLSNELSTMKKLQIWSKMVYQPSALEP